MSVVPRGVTTPANTLLAVSYARAALASRLNLVTAREQALGATFVRTTDYPALNTTLRVVSVPTAKVASTESALRAQSGVQSIGVTGEKRYPLLTSAYYTNDPYFTGFASDYEILPYAEASAVPGQWDMHAIGLEHAFGYVNGGTGGTAPMTANALGSSSIKIAIIDTGEDASHPELNSKIAYQKCFITNPSNVQSSGNYATDELGHGTDVSGIAAAASGNSLGFVGAGGKAVIYAYRVFPTPDDNCANENNSDDQCTSSTADIASAIDDAVTNHVNIISMSLGGGSCTGGVDNDSMEGNAISNAISHNIVVVAAAGNGSTGTLDAPACDTDVIAVGATGLDDGSALGTGTTSYTKNVSGASANNPIEYVASYSQYATPSQNVRSAAAWGIVAPGGDPSTAESQTNGPTPDDLHWIENIWTSTPYQSSANDNSFTGNCTSDFDSSGTVDCRTLIAGTSMATPHVAGAAALILAVTGGLSSPYQSPAAMKQLLCQTADDIGDTHEGCGRLNAYRAMATVLNDTHLP
jgi:subtilisin family serine protease